MELGLEHRRRVPGDRREKTVAALVSAAALAWSIFQYVSGFLHGVFDDIHVIDVHLASVTEAVANHERATAERIARLVRLEDQYSKCTEEFGAFRAEVEHRISRIEASRQ